MRTGRKTSVVTGAARGIGAEIARSLAADGVGVILTYRTSAREAAAVVDEAVAAGYQVRALPVDLRDGAAVEAFVERVLAEHGVVDILVNNAAAFDVQLVMGSNTSSWVDALHTNLVAPYRLSRGFLPAMLSQRWGRIVNISSSAADIAGPSQTAYCASKAGLNGFTRALAAEVGRRGVTVNAVAPGLVRTDMTRAIPDYYNDYIVGRSSLKRCGRVEEIASVVRFLASDRASQLTGQVLHVDGGLGAR